MITLEAYYLIILILIAMVALGLFTDWIIDLCGGYRVCRHEHKYKKLIKDDVLYTCKNCGKQL